MVPRWTFCSRLAEIGRRRVAFWSAIGQHGEPEKITLDKSGANTAAIDSYNAEREADIEMRQCKYLNDIGEQDHRAIKRIMRPMLGDWCKTGGASACRIFSLLFLDRGWGVEWILKLAVAGGDGPCVDIMEISKPDDLGDIANLGLTLTEAKQLLARLQREISTAQARRSGGRFAPAVMGFAG
jgi:hypothetical protein